MIALDSNVMLRYLVADDPKQAEQARALIDGAFAMGTPVWLSEIVLCETVWVLESSYKVGRKTIAAMLRRISESHFTLSDPEQVRDAIQRYEKGPADFSDYLLGELGKNAGAVTTYSFDNALRKDTNFTIIR